jgi:hypothetical protein
VINPLDSPYSPSYNLNHSEVVREKCLIEKDVLGGSIRRKSSPKSSEGFAEESNQQVDRHGIARYSSG